MKIKELDWQQLDWAVAKAVGQPVVIVQGRPYLPFEKSGRPADLWQPTRRAGELEPWAEKYKINSRWQSDGTWYATIYVGAERVMGAGPTRLVACCRALVALRLGQEIEVPKELL